jgi:hypothetical protein
MAPTPLLLRYGTTSSAKRVFWQRVLVVAQRAVHGGLVTDETEDLHRVAGEADVADFARALNLAQRRDRFIDDLLHRHELDVVAQHDVEMSAAEPVKRHIHALAHPFRGEIEVREIIAPELGAERVAVARHAFQRDTQQHLAHAAAVEGRRVDEVQSALQATRTLASTSSSDTLRNSAPSDEAPKLRMGSWRSVWPRRRVCIRRGVRNDLRQSKRYGENDPTNCSV